MNNNFQQWMLYPIGILIIGSIVGLMYMSYNNNEIKLKNQILAQQTSVSAYYDKMWKIISQKAQISEQYKSSFQQIYVDLMNGRYQNDSGSFMKWIQESNPQFDSRLYQDLMSTIDAERAGFLMEQRKLIDMDREYQTNKSTFPASIFIGNRNGVTITIITSDRTDSVYKTGKENSIDVFSN